MEERQLRQMGVLGVLLAALAAGVFLWEPSESPPDWDKGATEEVWSVARDQVTKVRIAGGEAPLALEQVDGAWWIREPIDERADDYRVGRLLGDLALVRRGIPIPDVDPASYGLEPPRFTVELTTPEGVETLKVGDDAAIEERFYAMSATGGVVAVGSLLTKDLGSRGASWYRSTQLLRYSRGAVDHITLWSEQGTLDLSRAEGQWWLEGFTRAEYEKVQDLLMAALDLRFDEFIEGFEGPIEEPSYTLTLSEHTEAGEVRHSLSVGGQSPQGVLVAVDGGPAGWVRPGPLAFLGQGPRDVGDPWAFPVRDWPVEHLDLDLGGTKLTLDRDGEGWVGQVPDPAALVRAVDEARIRYQRDAVEPITESWGAIIGRTDDQTQWTVELGQQVGEARVARDARGGASYLIPVQDLDAILSATRQP
ncbi:MAG: DUF4340 domain-containing protein [Deltaproteobacteria bacterium]|nr:DUF4340 domain-containing protein [Deltaproteobacteria bacterium]